MKTDCFAYDPKRSNKCAALLKAYCRTGECKFYKTREQVEAERLKSIQRRMSLGTEPTKYDENT